MEMFCYQCEQTAKGTGCVKTGVCGKDPEVALLQDLLIHGLKSIAIYGSAARQLGVVDKEVDIHIIESLFTTVTNVDFDSLRLFDIINKTYKMKEQIKSKFLEAYKNKNGKDFSDKLNPIVNWKPASDMQGILEEAAKVGILQNAKDEDIRSVRELLTYGLKGMAAYADHAHILGEDNETVNAFFHKALAALTDDSLKLEDYVALNMECGKVNLLCMETLDKANTKAYGDPVPTKVEIGHKKGPAILVSGHDLLDLYELLKQTEGTGINIYTHGEMLPAHGYPKLKKFSHLVGNYGGAWQDQQKEFDEFPGAILMTTNCIQKPKSSYIGRIFTTGLVAFPGVTHITDRKDFSLLINKAKEIGGFKNDQLLKEIIVGFGHNAVLGVADKVIEAVKSGAIKRFFLIGGCDGAKSGRNYYTELAESLPKDCVILTLACGKYRFNKLDFGDIGGIPRLLDIGQCNDSYSAVQIALALSNAFGVGVNELPLSIILSWYEQKAVCVLLTLLSLGIKNIKIGPSLPAFVSKNVLDFLVKNFNLGPITTAQQDLKQILG